VSISKRIVKHTVNFGLGNALPRAINLLLIPIYTIFLTPEDFGIVELTTSLGGFLVILMRFGVPGSVSRYYFEYRDNEQDVRDYATTVYYFLMASSVVVALIAGILLYYFRANITPGLPFYPFIVLAIINSGLSSNSDLQKRLLQAREQSRYMALLNIGFSLFTILLTVTFVVFLRMAALGIVLAQVVTSFAFFFQAQYYLRSDLRGRFRLGLLYSSLKYGVGILPHHLFAALTPLIAKALLVSSSSLVALGLYSVALKLTLPLEVLYRSFSQGFQPVYFDVRKQLEKGTAKENELPKLFQRIWLLAVACFSGVVLLGPLVMVKFIPSAYHDAVPLVPIIAIGFLGEVLYLLHVSDLYYTKRTGSVPIITALGLMVNLGFTYAVVDEWGAKGVALGAALGYVTWAAISFVLSRNVIEIYGLSFFVSLLIGGVVYFLNSVVPFEHLAYRLLSLIGVCLLLAFLNFAKSRSSG
jgi:O-antigen/teichoic acid export membrane protein